MGKASLDSISLTCITKQLDNGTLFHFMLWLKDEKGIGNIRDLPIKLVLNYLKEFEKTSDYCNWEKRL